MANDRFWANVKVGPPNRCWEWAGTKSDSGYGLFKINYKQYRAHRLIYELWHRVRLTEGEQVCHRCDNPGCVNPFHLFTGIHDDNMSDMARKGRSPRGSRNGMAKLTRKDVLTIRNRSSKGEPVDVISEDYPVSSAAIYRIIARKTWKHV